MDISARASKDGSFHKPTKRSALTLTSARLVHIIVRKFAPTSTEVTAATVAMASSMYFVNVGLSKLYLKESTRLLNGGTVSDFRLADSLSGVCKVVKDEVILMFANGPEIRAFVQDKNEELDIIASEKRIEAIDYDPKNEMVFWADSYDKTIKRSYMINAKQGEVKSGFAQDLNMKGNAKPTSLAIDYVGDNLYWTEVDRAGSKPRGRVMVARTDGRYRRALVSAGLESPTSLVLDPQMGKMIWADAGSAPKIEMAWMDGSKRRPVVRDSIRHPTGLAIDSAMDHAIYWVDTKLNTIEMMKHDGSNRKVILKGDLLKHPISLDVFESSLYWVTRDTGELVRQDKFGRGVPFIISKDLVNPSAVKGKKLVKHRLPASSTSS